MPACCSLKNVCEYETSKVVRIQSVYYGSIKWAIHSVVFLYVCVVLIADKRYQKRDAVISSVHTKVKGVAQTDQRIYDTAEYTVPMQGIDSFFVVTNIIMTENQIQGLCPEFPIAKAVCSTDRSCAKGRMDPQSNGIQTGRCVKYNATVKTCEVTAWCPVESIKSAPKPAILRSAENFTVLIKNNIHFPKFNYTTRNISPEFNISCTYNKISAPYCPIFRLGDILQEAGENFSEVAIQGLNKFYFTVSEEGCLYTKAYTLNKTLRPDLSPPFAYGGSGDVIIGEDPGPLQTTEVGHSMQPLVLPWGGIVGIEINWDCNLDRWLHRCSPKYGFRRLDDKKASEALYPGYNFRFAKYYKQANGREERTLIKAYGIRFDILVFGMCLTWIVTVALREKKLPCFPDLNVSGGGYLTSGELHTPQDGGQFNFFELLVYIGSALSYFGLAQLFVDFLITSYTFPCFKSNPVKEYYYRKKCESVPGPRWTLLYVAYVDEPHIIMIDKLLRTSLQKIKGEIIQRRSGNFTHSAKLPPRHPEEAAAFGNAQELQPLQKKEDASPHLQRPSWCCCGKCRPAQPYWEQLCCRRKDGACIATSALFDQLVLSRPALEFVLLYEDPLLDLKAETLNKLFRHAAYKQYILWRFGEDGNLAKRAVLPNCCRWKIREAFPSEDGQYTGFRKKK